MKKIKVSEIFSSIQGEGRYAGYPMLFIRLSGCTRACWYCLVKNSKISTPKGVKNIQDFQKGDEVLSYDFNNKKIVQDKIKKVFKREVNEIIRIKLDRSGFGESHIFVTSEHLFYTTENQWVKAKDLQTGMELFELRKYIHMLYSNPGNSSINHGRYQLQNSIKILKVDKINLKTNRHSYVRLAGSSKEKIKVYNIETENSNYFVNRVLIHNCDTKYHTQGIEMEIEELIEKINKSKLRYVCWTGGEPLLQIEAILEIIKKTKKKCHHLETNGDLIETIKKNWSLFQYIAISPKDVRIAQKVGSDWALGNQSDIKVVTDLEKEGVDMIPYATMLMPLSTYTEKDLEIQRKVWEYCVNNNLKFTPRYQMWIWGQKRGV